MEFVKSFNGNQVPYTRKYQIAETFPVAGVPAEAPTLSDVVGVLRCEVQTCNDCLGVTMDAQATRLTAQQADGSDPEVAVTVVINPDAIYEAKLAGGPTPNTPITINTNTVASTDGLLLTLGLSAGFDDGYAWGFDGANAGIARKIVAVAGTNETVTIAFPRDIAVGDRFLACTFGPGEIAGMNTTNEVSQIRADADGQTNDNFRCVDADFLDEGASGDTESRVRITIFDHHYASGGSV